MSHHEVYILLTEWMPYGKRIEVTRSTNPQLPIAG